MQVVLFGDMLKNLEVYVMKDKDVENVLIELENVRPEKLNDKAKRLFEAIMKIAERSR